MLCRSKIKNLIINATRAAIKNKKLPALNLSKAMEESFWESVTIKHPENQEFGDYASNAALRLSKLLKMKPMAVAEIIASGINNGKNFRRPRGIGGFLNKVKAAEPGFVNFYLSQDYLRRSLLEILKSGDEWGDLKIGKNQKIQIEFLSANPTGPITLGNGRGGFTGDVLRNIMKAAGYIVEAEYFINDSKHSHQIRELGKTVLGKGESYKSAYLAAKLADLKIAPPAKEPDIFDIEGVGYRTAKAIFKDQKKTIEKKLKINFNRWFSEQSLYDDGEVSKVVNKLDNLGVTYKKDSAVWLKTSVRGDDEDRVLIRANGEPTYIVSDLAYHASKFKRGYQKMINFWGADHHSHAKKLRIGLEILGHDSSRVEFIITQLARLVKDGQEVKISKRKGQYVALEELIDEVGLDAARFFFLMVSANRHMDFDLTLAKEKSEKNPVYYAQYANARIASIMEKLKKERGKNKNLELLKHPTETALMKQLIRLPEIIEDTAKDYQVQRLPNYVIELARAFHNFYDSCRVASDNKDLTRARSALILAARIVLKKTLALMGVSAPEKM